MPSTHLLIIGDRAALSWMVTEQRMAFPAGRSKAARALEEGDEVFLYTTRGCFRNPTRDLGRVIGRALATSSVRVLDEPVVFGERTSTEGCRLEVSGPDLRLRRFPELRPAKARESTWAVGPVSSARAVQGIHPIPADTRASRGRVAGSHEPD
ncbi:hypothetical protein ACFXDI_29295 [Streptomyces mirabilis]|uniref:hypothetical protein n=1 Tax=Streptomyces mirabilis TaxID=68239 RepID=UPI0036A67E28